MGFLNFTFNFFLSKSRSLGLSKIAIKTFLGGTLQTPPISLIGKTRLFSKKKNEGGLYPKSYGFQKGGTPLGRPSF